MAAAAGTIGAVAAAAAIPALISLIDKKGKGRRAYSKGSEYYKRGSEAAGIAKSFNTELKTYDYFGSNYTNAGAGPFSYDVNGWSDAVILTNVNLGDGGYQDWNTVTDGQGACNGNSIKIRRHLFRFIFTPNSGIAVTDGVTTRVRLLMWTDREKQAGANLAQPLDILQKGPASSDTDVQYSILSPLEVDNFGRFQILHDKVYQLDQAQNGQIDDAHHAYFKNHELHAMWDSTNTHSETDTIQGHIMCAVYFENVTVDTSTGNVTISRTKPPAFQCWSRIRYIDN